jgi:hypothetical protein
MDNAQNCVILWSSIFQFIIWLETCYDYLESPAGSLALLLHFQQDIGVTGTGGKKSIPFNFKDEFEPKSGRVSDYEIIGFAPVSARLEAALEQVISTAHGRVGISVVVVWWSYWNLSANWRIILIWILTECELAV